MQLTIPDELAAKIVREAEIHQVTPEDVVLSVLRGRFNGHRENGNGHATTEAVPESGDMSSEHKTLAGFLGDFVGCLDSSERFPKGSTLARDAGQIFGEMLDEERREQDRP